MELEESSLKEIERYYSKALRLIQAEDYFKATRLLYNEMPDKMYDTSLDILFNRNFKSVTQEFNELRELIRIVDCKLIDYSTKSEEVPDMEDKFNGDIF